MFASEIRDVLGYDSPARRPGGCRDLSVFGCGQADLGYMGRVVTVGVAQDRGGGRREHLIDQEGGHASSAAR